MEKDVSKLKPTPGEETYVAFDDEYGFGVFGDDSGFCYFLGDEKSAIEESKRLNKSRGK